MKFFIPNNKKIYMQDRPPPTFKQVGFTFFNVNFSRK